MQASENSERAVAVTFEPVGEQVTTRESSPLKKLMPEGRRRLAVSCAFYGKSAGASTEFINKNRGDQDWSQALLCDKSASAYGKDRADTRDVCWPGCPQLCRWVWIYRGRCCRQTSYNFCAR